MTQRIHARAWVRTMPDWSEADQAREIEAWCKRRGWGVAVFPASTYSWSHFLNDMREHHAAIVSRLDAILPAKRPKGIGPRAAFDAALVDLAVRSIVIVDVARDVMSDNRKSWDDAVAAARRDISRGKRKLDAAEARKMQKRAAAARRRRSVVAKWLGRNPTSKALRDRWRVTWRSMEYPDWKAALAALPEELHGVSRKSLYEIFGPRGRS